VFACSAQAAYAGDSISSTTAQERQALDATGDAGVPADWDPVVAESQVATKQPSPAAVAAVTAALSGTATSSSDLAAASVPASVLLAANQTTQKTEAWCDPASVHEALDAIHISMTQSAAADALGTDGNGTPWFNGSSAPVPYPTRHVLNDKIGFTYYYVVDLPNSPTSAQKAAFAEDLVSDAGQGYPLIGNAYEVVDGPHLVGHPNELLKHYIEIRGYHDSGSQTNYEDSIHGNTQVGWYANVPAYSQISSDKMTTILGDRGYVW
jgi:hypothetical protein